MTIGVMMLVLVEAGSLLHPRLQHLGRNDLHLLLNRQDFSLENDIQEGHPNSKLFQNMVNRNHELTAVESHVIKPGITSPKIEEEEEVTNDDDLVLDPADAVMTSSSSTSSSSSRVPAKKVIVTTRKNIAQNKPHSRQKRFIVGSKLRTIAVPLSIFNFLGFLPVRVPGLPYHNDLPSPDYSYYNTIHELPKRNYRYY